MNWPLSFCKNPKKELVNRLVNNGMDKKTAEILAAEIIEAKSFQETIACEGVVSRCKEGLEYSVDGEKEVDAATIVPAGSDRSANFTSTHEGVTDSEEDGGSEEMAAAPAPLPAGSDGTANPIVAREALTTSPFEEADAAAGWQLVEAPVRIIEGYVGSEQMRNESATHMSAECAGRDSVLAMEIE